MPAATARSTKSGLISSNSALSEMVSGGSKTFGLKLTGIFRRYFFAFWVTEKSSEVCSSNSVAIIIFPPGQQAEAVVFRLSPKNAPAESAP